MMFTRPAWLLRIEEAACLLAAPSWSTRTSLQLAAVRCALSCARIFSCLAIWRIRAWAPRSTTLAISCCPAGPVRGSGTDAAAAADGHRAHLVQPHCLRPAAGLWVEISGTLQRHPSATCGLSATIGQTHAPSDALRCLRPLFDLRPLLSALSSAVWRR